LIDEGHSVNTIDHNSWTPLHEVKLFVSVRNGKKVITYAICPSFGARNRIYLTIKL
jgi:hypothetical protein